ncbi:roadblock/LC7 domain-containing protein [Pseudomonadota bacterium]
MSFVTDAIEKISHESEAHENDVSAAIQKKLSEVLDELMSKSTDFVGATVSSIDGLAWAEKISSGLDKHRFAAMSSSLLAISDELANEVEGGQTNNVLIEGVSGKVIIMHAGPLLLLTIFTTKNVTLGMALAHARIVAENIESIEV